MRPAHPSEKLEPFKLTCMLQTDILIIGGGVAGTTVAETFRAGNTDTTVTIVSDEKHPLYSRVLLPHAVLGKVADEKVYLKSESFYDTQDIQYLTGVTVESVHTKEKTVTLSDGEIVRYEKLVIATGGRPRAWSVPGADKEGILHLQTYEDIYAIRNRLNQGGDMVIVGTGFIGMEFASFAIASGIKATMLNRGPHFCSSVFSPEMGEEISRILEEHGLTIMHHAEVESVLGETAVEGVRLVGGDTITCRTIGLGIGLELNTAPFASIGVSVGVLADTHLKADAEDVWVAGDCCEFDDELLGLRHAVGNWTNAMAQGRHIGKALLGESEPYSQLTAYTSRCVPGISLIYLGETKMLEGVTRHAKVLEPGKVVQLNRKNGRLVGAVLLNAPAHRSVISEAMTQQSDLTIEHISTI